MKTPRQLRSTVLAACALAFALLAAGCSSADGQQVVSTGSLVETAPPTEVAELEPTSQAGQEQSEIVCSGQVVSLATATVAPPLPPPPIDPEGEAFEAPQDADVDESMFPTPTPEPTPVPTAQPLPVATRLDGGFEATGAVPAPEQLEPGTVWVRIGDTDHVGTGVYFPEARGWVRVIIGQGSKTIEFNLDVDEVGTPRSLRVGDMEPSTIYGGDAVAQEFEVAEGPARNETTLTWKGDVAAGQPPSDEAGPTIWAGGTFDMNVCELYAPLGHRMTGAFNIRTR